VQIIKPVFEKVILSSSEVQLIPEEASTDSDTSDCPLEVPLPQQKMHEPIVINSQMSQ